MSLTASLPDVADAWAALHAELDALAAAGRTVPLWWRDDDATEPSPALDRLLALATRHDVPVALAVVPAGTGPALADCVRACPQASVLQHGWSHANHAADDSKSVELGGDRPESDVTAELAQGREKLEGLFGDRFVPVLVPPWNRIDAALLPAMAAMGYPAISVFGPEKADAHPPEINVHIDPIDWHNGRRFFGEAMLVGDLAAALRSKRTDTDSSIWPAVGLMTHHWAHDDALWDVLDRLLGLSGRHPAIRWPSAGDLIELVGP